MIKRATILKHLKHHGKYERSHFTKKKGELEEICKKLGIDLTKNIDDGAKEVVKAPVKPKVVIQEPESSSDESSDEDEDVPTKIPQTPLPSPVTSPKVAKKLKRKNQKVEKLEKVKVEPDNSKKNTVTNILKDLNSVVKELFSEFNKNEVDDVDAEYIKTEFHSILNEAQDLIDPLVTEFSDTEIQKIESRIDLQYRKLERFLS